MQDGGPAFPQTHESWGGYGETNPVPEGMSLRDWFAGMVLGNCSYKMFTPKHQANLAYSLADAMLAERDKEA